MAKHAQRKAIHVILDSLEHLARGLAAASGRRTRPAVAPPPSAASLEAASARCDVSKLGPPQLRRLSLRQLENTLRDVFPEVASTWTGINQSDVSSPLGFSNDASVLVVSRQTAAALQASAEQLADLVSDKQLLAASLACAAKPDDTCAREWISRYGQRLFRRPLTDAELDRYAKLFDAASSGASFEKGVKWTLTALIQSPHTLYRRELGELTSDVTQLDNYELATELAYTFGETTPDAELSALAAKGKLSDPEVRLAQARRLLETPRGREGLAQFFREWLRYESVRTVDRPAIAGFAELRPDLIEETRRFLAEIAFEQHGGVRELLLSETTFVNAALARYYELKEPAADFQRATRDPARGVGILAQASVLVSTAHANASSPTQRGLMVRERFLCRTRPKPPADVPPLSSSDQSTYKTTRQHYEQAHARGYCQACHVQFDPIGFAFEHFDEGGRYRADENAEPIDATGKLLRQDGNAAFDFDGLTELANGLADDDEVVDCVSGQLVAYAFGGASCLAETARQGFRQGDYGLVELLARLVREPHFTQRESAEIQQNFHTSPYQDFDESDDYSFAADFTEYRDHDHLCVYYDKRLVWGTPP